LLALAPLVPPDHVGSDLLSGFPFPVKVYNALFDTNRQFTVIFGGEARFSAIRFRMFAEAGVVSSSSSARTHAEPRTSWIAAGVSCFADSAAGGTGRGGTGGGVFFVSADACRAIRLQSVSNFFTADAPGSGDQEHIAELTSTTTATWG